jgi:hypothetical protein
VKSLGISILEEDVQKQVAINTTNGLTFASERQAKAYATLQIAQAQSKNAIGDYARTQDGLANQTRLLQQRMNDLAVSFGEIMVPAINDLVGSLTFVTEAMRDMDDSTKRVIIGVAGFVAIVGPALFAIGALTKGVVALGLAFTTSTGPIGMMITAIGLLTGAYIMHKMTVTEAESATKALVTMNKGFAQALTANAAQMAGFADEAGRTADELEAVNDAFKVMVAQATARANSLEQSLAGARAELYEIERTGSGNILTGFGADSDRAKELREQIKALSASLNPLYGFLTKASEGMEAFGTATTDTTTGTGGTDYAAGSIGALTEELQALQIQFDTTGDSMKRAQLGAQINQLTNEIKGMDAVAKANILPITAPMERATIAAQRLTTSVDGLNRGFIPLAKAPVTITELTTQMAMAQQFATQFTDSFGAGMANVLVQSQDVMKTLENIGKLLLSSAIQTGIKFLLMGSSGFGVSGGFGGLFGGLFKPQVASVPTQVMGAGMMSVSGSFKVQGTDLIAVINRSERQLR